MKRIISVISFIFALLSGLFVWFGESQIADSYPAGTSQAFILDLRNSPHSKSELVSILNKFAVDQHVVLLKTQVTTGAGQESTLQKNVLWFGDAPAPDRISWFDKTIGQVIVSTAVSTQDLSGSYAMGTVASATEAIDLLQDMTGGSVSQFRSKDVVGVLSSISQTAVGLSLGSLFIIVIAVAAMWNVSLTQSRRVRATAGQSYRLILQQDLFDLVRNQLMGLLSAFIVAIVIFRIVASIDWLKDFAVLLGISLLLFLVVNVMIFSALSLSSRSVDNLISRLDPVGQQMSGVNYVVRLGAFIMIALSVPQAIAFSAASNRSYTEVVNWAQRAAAFKIAVNTVTLDDPASYAKTLTQFLAKENSDHNVAMSMTIDQMVSMSATEMTPYDHVIVTDPDFLTWVGVDRQKDLRQITWNNVPTALKNEVQDNIKAWTTVKNLPPMNLYESTAAQSFPTLGSVAEQGNAVSAERPLILVVNDPYSTFESDGFLSVLLANGQIIFKDANQLMQDLDASGMQPYVASVDNLSDRILDSARAYALQYWAGVFAAAVSLSALFVLLFQSAYSWRLTQRRKIFAYYTNGSPYYGIVWRRVTFEVVVFAVMSVLSLVAISLFYEDLSEITLVTAFLLFSAVYLLTVVVFYLLASKAAVSASIHRKY